MRGRHRLHDRRQFSASQSLAVVRRALAWRWLVTSRFCQPAWRFADCSFLRDSSQLHSIWQLRQRGAADHAVCGALERRWMVETEAPDTTAWIGDWSRG